ncbi:unnamed protein product [Didymodactylos carnosus]|uniref:Uncharacterized protein n=1 Tax=Didymodactylos carnosus TaxID=1234261 RepID=A0A815L7N9_9BILA|nr:unnamed protein product [Didymodactylos carnosus]CAF1400617.1 unnamed protein product [Didymodactylos carnosus]CAF3838711.1 unnamed protein product [Didymodactylos carnosus]CAF4294503.1 unnamed protein product [Didymodactylos carnosus]
MVQLTTTMTIAVATMIAIMCQLGCYGAAIQNRRKRQGGLAPKFDLNSGAFTVTFAGTAISYTGFDSNGGGVTVTSSLLSITATELLIAGGGTNDQYSYSATITQMSTSSIFPTEPTFDLNTSNVTFSTDGKNIIMSGTDTNQQPITEVTPIGSATFSPANLQISSNGELHMYQWTMIAVTVTV